MRALIAGLGLIGGSIGMALRARRWTTAYRDPHVSLNEARRAAAAGDVVDPKEHDESVALTSHLPQLLSTALAAYAERSGVDIRFAGSGLRTFLRLAGSDASVWKPIVDSNRGAIEKHLNAVIEIARTIDDSAFA